MHLIMGMKILLVINLIVFLIYGLDKQLAIRGKNRISEKMLLLFAFFLGSGGAFLGMIIFKHKISKTSFLVKFGVVVILQILLFYIMMNELELNIFK